MCRRVLFFGGNMKTKNKLLRIFTLRDILLWLFSVAAIVVSFLLFGKGEYLTLAASLIGVTSLIFNAKGNPVGQALMVVFSVMYGYISYTFSYYGEMITYLGMTLPMAVAALVSWIKNPFDGNRAQVRVYKLNKKDIAVMCILTVIVTAVFYFILKYFNTANLVLSTVSVTTSFAAVYMTYKRSPAYAIGYAANDMVLIALWVLASRQDSSYISVVVCFVIFLVNDLYGFLCWRVMEKKQRESSDNILTDN